MSEALKAVRRAAKPYQAARRRYEHTRRSLVAAIREAEREGASVRAIAEAAGISFQRVQQIVSSARRSE